MNVTMFTGILLVTRCLLFNILNLFSCIRFYLLFNGLRFPFLFSFFFSGAGQVFADSKEVKD